MFIYLIGGLLLGWALGSNDAANVFGGAVSTKMISFRKATILCSLFLIAGAVIQGGGASETLTALGTSDTIHDAFLITMSSAITIFAMSKWGIPVSTSQSIVGGIIGWNLFHNYDINFSVLNKIFVSWVSSPILAAFFAIIFYIILKKQLQRSKIHILKQDALTRGALIFTGCFGAYSLGANNIANIMGVYLNSFHLNTLNISFIRISSDQQIFFIGALAIALGVITYSLQTMKTVGNRIFKLTPEAAFIAVLSHSLVLFIFSSKSLGNLLTSIGLPAIPLVPVSSSQAIVGAVLGLGLIKGGRGVNFSVMGEIALGWVATPIVSGLLTYALLTLSIF